MEKLCGSVWSVEGQQADTFYTHELGQIEYGQENC